MEELSNIQIQSEYVETKIVESVAVVKVKKNGFKNLSNITPSSRIFEWTEVQKKTAEIKSILFYFYQDSLSENNYRSFLVELSGNENLDWNLGGTIVLEKRLERSIELNMLFNYARRLSNINKLVFFCASGEVVTPYFGISLLADFRLATKSMSFNLAHRKFGLHPSGLLPLMLQKYVGFGGAKKILISEEIIKAEKALDMGLVDNILQEENFEENCIKEALKYSQISQNVITSTKDLMWNFNKEVEEYINKEQKYINK